MKSTNEIIEEQLDQAKRAVFIDQFNDFSIIGSTSSQGDDPIVYHEELESLECPGLKFVGGVDISCRSGSNGDEDDCIVTLVVCSYPSMEFIDSKSRAFHLDFPYIPSFLSFREAAAMSYILQDQLKSGGSMPQVLLVDGNGRLHPRQAGSAVVIGLNTGIPTIGVAKEYLPPSARDPSLAVVESTLPYPIDFLASQKGMKLVTRHHLKQRGDWIGLESHVVGPETIGAAILSSPIKTSTRPIFVSPGHLISLESSLRLALACSTGARVPEPIRLADAISREEVLNWEESKSTMFDEVDRVIPLARVSKSCKTYFVVQLDIVEEAPQGKTSEKKEVVEEAVEEEDKDSLGID